MKRGQIMVKKWYETEKPAAIYGLSNVAAIVVYMHEGELYAGVSVLDCPMRDVRKRRIHWSNEGDYFTVHGWRVYLTECERV